MCVVDRSDRALGHQGNARPADHRRAEPVKLVALMLILNR